jgi:hydroxyacylglutathione hydrolase/adenylyltransferase/sulfurtransferase
MTSETVEHDIEIGPAQAAEKIAEGAQLVDVRQDFEWDAGRIPGAEHIPLEQLPAASERFDRDRPIVFQCRTGSRSGMASQIFRASGFEAYNLSGGLEAWGAEGREIEPDGGFVAGPRPDAS